MTTRTQTDTHAHTQQIDHYTVLLLVLYSTCSMEL